MTQFRSALSTLRQQHHGCQMKHSKDIAGKLAESRRKPPTSCDLPSSPPHRPRIHKLINLPENSIKRTPVIGCLLWSPNSRLLLSNLMKLMPAVYLLQYPHFTSTRFVFVFHCFVFTFFPWTFYKTEIVFPRIYVQILRIWKKLKHI